MFDSLEDVPIGALSRRSQAALGSLLSQVRRLHHTKGAELIFVFLPGCHACAAAKPALLRFAKKHPNVRVRSKSLAALKLTDKELKNVVTPTYYLRTPRGRYHKIEGALERVLDIEAWVSDILEDER